MGTDGNDSRCACNIYVVMGLSSKSQLGFEQHLGLDSISIPFLRLADQFSVASFPSPVFSSSNAVEADLYLKRGNLELKGLFHTVFTISTDHLEVKPLLLLFLLHFWKVCVQTNFWKSTLCDVTIDTNSVIPLRGQWRHLQPWRKVLFPPAAELNVFVLFGGYSWKTSDFCSWLSQRHNWHF